MKKVFKWILIILLIVFVLIQFIRPAKNKSDSKSANDISTLYAVPDSVESILKVVCYDCHSNNTVYPWYAEIQPVTWWLNNHIVDGKKDLNFSEFTKYRIRKQYIKFDEINKLVKGNVMPLASYTWVHTNAKLSDKQKQVIIVWSASIRDSIKTHYPPDSLARKK